MTHRECIETLERMQHACQAWLRQITAHLETMERTEKTGAPGEWKHGRRKRSQMFTCPLCGGTAYYPQPNNSKAGAGPVILYRYCPHCGRPMNPIE